MEKVILINPPADCVEDDHLEPQLGLLYIASVMRAQGIPVQIYEMTGCKTESGLRHKIENIPEGAIYGITTYCTNYMFVKKCIEHIRTNLMPATIILGGPNPTALPELTLMDSACDCVIVGEGEDAFLNTVTLIINKCSYSKIIKGKRRLDINTYPFPSWDLIDLKDYTRELAGKRAISLISSRGCKFSCLHCNSIVMGGGNSVSYRDPGNICDEINQLRLQGYTRFRFNDDNFTGNPNLKGLLNEIKELDINYRIFGRIEDLTEENCRLLAESGCLHVSVGLESLNPDNLRVIGKISQTGVESKHIEYAKKYGLAIRAYFIVGLPFDTEASIEKYFNQAARISFDEFSIYPLIPYPGTRIARDPKKYGYSIIDDDFTHYVQIGINKTTSFSMRHRNFTEDDVHRWLEYAEGILISSNKVTQKETKIAN